MIMPMSQEELERATYEEVIHAYAKVGIDREGAEAYLAIIRNPAPKLIVD